MNLESAVRWLALRHPFSSAFIVTMAAGFLLKMSAAIRAYWLYALSMVIVFSLAWERGSLIYFYTFILGVLTAFTEIINKFPDEPMKALGSTESVVYHITNGLIAVFALRVLLAAGVPIDTPINQVKVVVVAGLGSMLVMRSKLFNIKVGGNDISFGPEQIVNLFFAYMEKAIDRIRAQARVEFVLTSMKNLDFEKIYSYTVTMLYAPLTWTDAERTQVRTQLEAIKNDTTIDLQEKSYRLGFTLLNVMGENFVTVMYEAQRPEWLLRAPLQGPSIIEKVIGGRTTYFSYGPNMTATAFLATLGYPNLDAAEFEKSVQATNGLLKGYRAVFNKPSKEHPGYTEINIEADPDGAVEGVIYRLNQSDLAYLNQSEPGYSLQLVNVSDGAKTIVCQTFAYDGVRLNAPPEQSYALSIVRGASLRGLSRNYVDQLRAAAGIKTTAAA